VNFLPKNSKCGRQFPLFQKISQIKFPRVKVDGVVTIGFSGMQPLGVPKFPIIREHHPDVQWKDVVPYFADHGSPYISHSCQSCSHSLGHGDPQVHVKGTIWTLPSLGSDPSYRLFTFCPTLECINDGVYKMKSKNVQFPGFENHIGISEKVKLDVLRTQGTKIVFADESVLAEKELYSLETNSELVASFSP